MGGDKANGAHSSARWLVRLSLVLALVLALGLALVFGAGAHAGQVARPDEAPQQARLYQIVEAVNDPRALVLTRLTQFFRALPPGASHAFRRDVLQAIRATQVESGAFGPSEATNEELRRLATAARDNDGLADALLHDAVILIKQERVEEVRRALGAADRLMTADAPAALRMRRHLIHGRLHAETSEFEKAAQHFLDMLTLARTMPRRAEQETQAALSFLAHLYTSMQDPARALATADEALALPVAQPEPRLLARLHYVRALALIGLKRQPQAWQAFNHALSVSRKAGLQVLEAFILANMADAELHAERWVQAEQTARLALAVSTKISDEAAATIARANIGFALGGQGKLDAALPWIDGVIAQFRKSGSTVSLQSMLDEKGRMLERAGRTGEALAVVREEQRVKEKLFIDERTRTVAGLQEKFDSENKRRQIALLQRDNRIKDADIDNRKLRQLATTLVAVMTVAAAIFLFMLYRRLRKSNMRLAYLAVHDPLTGLYNRRSFVDRMGQRRPVAHERRPLVQAPGDCVILLDIDHFKAVNDTYGHAGGDAVLVEVARRLQQEVRDADMVLRWGGEEFLVFAEGTTHEQALVLVRRILAAVSRAPVLFEQHSIVVTTSAGFAALPFAGLAETTFGWERIVALADAALYLAKAGGRNRACGPSALLGDPELALAAVERALDQAVRDGLVEMSTVLGHAVRKSDHSDALAA